MVVITARKINESFFGKPNGCNNNVLKGGTHAFIGKVIELDKKWGFFDEYSSRDQIASRPLGSLAPTTETAW